MAKKQRRYNSSENYDYTKVKEYEYSNEIRTIPNQAHTVQDLMERYRRGTMPVGIERNLEYDEEETFETSVLHDPAMDITDVALEAKNLQEKIKLAETKKKQTAKVTQQARNQGVTNVEGNGTNTTPIEPVEPKPENGEG